MRRALWCSAFLSVGAVGTGWTQLAPTGTGGVAALAGALEQLGAVKRVLVIGAHPDDENTQLLTWLSRGAGAQAAYLSLSRGEGGQNLIGPELGAELGVIRSEELLAARQLDGARQFFTRAYDFGFSKSADEAWRFWPRDSLLKDVVDVIRRFRPQVLVTIFSGTASDGHGQHQVAGLIARQAFELLKDSAWGPVKLYHSRFFDTTGTTLTIPAGVLDPILGQSYSQIAAASRSRHRSQDMGQLQRPGPSAIRLSLLAARRGIREGATLFAGVDTTLPGRPRYAALIDSARIHLNPWNPQAVVPILTRALRELGTADAEQRALLESALAIAAGVAIDGVADDGIVTTGQRAQIEVTVWNAGAAEVRLDSVEVRTPGWTVQRLDAATVPIAPGAVATRRFVVNVPQDGARTEPYFLRRPLVGALYDWTGVPADIRGLPFEPPPMEARVRVTIDGEPITLTREVVYRYRDQMIGEVRRPVFVTREFDIAVSPDLAVWPIDQNRQSSNGSQSSQRFIVTVTNRTRGATVARISVTPPSGWSAVPAESLTFQREDETKSFGFALTAPPTVAPGTFQIRVAALGTDGSRSDGALSIIDYPHIRPRGVAHASTVRIHTVRLALPFLTRVGYVRGASDRVPEELQAIGVPLELLSPETLARGDLSRYDAIVIGSRAYETDPALVANNGRILEYARGGGLVIVQYQQYAFVDGGFAPYRLTIARPHDRVTDETASVTLLDSTHAVFRRPNAIGADDWAGWVQERGLYFANQWDSTYVPVLAMQDPSSAGPPLQGGLLIAPLGRGTYVYTGLSFFRELPAGVPGAYRLFVNLLGLRRRDVP